jgi:GT2 family glycosyltransferase
VCFLDSDARLGPLALARLAAPVLAEPDVALAGPVFAGQPPEASGGRAPTVRRKLARMLNLSGVYEPVDRPPGSSWWDVDFVIGACQVFRRVAFDAVGGLDERYFYGPEDIDFCLRLRERGWRVVQVAGAEVEHPPRRRNKRFLSLGAFRHGLAVARHQWRHRHHARSVGR